ncbi:MAG: GNAT family N-acetyltransferase [Ardenticatenaceae bacterium]|nr:GNAT family N-acetyltransferase [Ardenticatenaceae bacterium]
MVTEFNTKSALPAHFTARPTTMDDLEAAVSLLNTCAIHITGAPNTNLADLRSEWEDPTFDLQASSQVVFSPEGQLVGYIEVWDTAPIPVTPWVWGRVHPAYEGQGIGSFLMEWGEARARQAIARCPDDVRVAFHSSTPSTYLPAQRLFLRHGLSLVRHFWRMAIEFDEAPQPVVWNNGLTIRTFADVPDLTAVYQASDDAFQDHWGHVAQPMETGIKQWQHWVENDPDFDPTLWLLAMDGDQIAGISLCRHRADDDPDMGWVNNLGVRRPWRQKGLGLALLQHSFAVLHQRGKQRVGLGVDADSLTGATRLYEKAGMKVIRQADAYEKVLRPGRDISRH